MENNQNEPLDMNLDMAENQPFEPTDGASDYLPPFPNYYLHKAAKFAQLVFWVSTLGIAYSLFTTVSFFMKRLDMESIFADDYGVLSREALSLCLTGFPLFFLFRFAKNTKLGIETDDRPLIDSGTKSLYHWFLTTLVTQGILIGHGLISTLLYTFLSVKGSFALTLFVLLASFMGFYFWRENSKPGEFD